MKKSLWGISLATTIACLSAATHPSLAHQDAAPASTFGLGRELHQLQQDFDSLDKTCFTPFTLEQPKENERQALVRLWGMMRKQAEQLSNEADRLSGQERIDKINAACAIKELMLSFLQACNDCYLRTLILCKDTTQTMHAVVTSHISTPEHQTMLLAIFKQLAFATGVAFQTLCNGHNTPDQVDLGNPGQLVLGAYKRCTRTGRSWLNISEQRRVERILLSSAWSKYTAIFRTWTECIKQYANLIQITPKDLSKQTVILEPVEELVAQGINLIEAAQRKPDCGPEAQRILSYADNWLNRIEKELGTIRTYMSFKTPMLYELYAIHQALIASPEFHAVKTGKLSTYERLAQWIGRHTDYETFKAQARSLTEEYERLASVFFQQQPNNGAYLAHVHLTMQSLQTLVRAQRSGMLLRLCLKESAIVSVVDGMSTVLHAFAHWNDQQRQQAESLIAWLLPAKLQQNSFVRRIMQRGTSLEQAVWAALVPAAFGWAAHLIERPQTEASPIPTTPAQELAELARNNPEVFKALLAKDPEIITLLAARYRVPGEQVGA